MINHISNFLNESQINNLYEIWFNSNLEHYILPGNKYKLELINFTDKFDDLNLNFLFDRKFYNKLLLQAIDETHIDSLYGNRFHTHVNEWTSVIYLNTNYDGGELEFKNGKIIKPNKGDQIYFSENEYHKVNFPYNFIEEYYIDKNNKSHKITKRISLVSFLNADVLNISNKKLF